MGIKMKENSAAVLKILLGVCYITPLIIAVLFSIQPNKEIGMAPLKFFTENPTIQNFIDVWNSTPFLTYLKNTFVMVIICVPCQLIFASLSAFAFTFYKFPGQDLLFTLFLATMMIPGEVTLISNYATIQNMGLYNTYAGMTITSLVNVSAMFMLRQHMRSLPKELWEAAKIDGANPLAIMMQIIVPLATGTISTVFVLTFITYWNDFQIPMVYIPSHPVAAYGMYVFQNTPIPEIANTPTRLAGIFLMALPIVVFYAIFNKKLNVNLSVGGIKG